MTQRQELKAIALQAAANVHTNVAPEVVISSAEQYLAWLRQGSSLR